MQRAPAVQAHQQRRSQQQQLSGTSAASNTRMFADSQCGRQGQAAGGPGPRHARPIQVWPAPASSNSGSAGAAAAAAADATAGASLVRHRRCRVAMLEDPASASEQQQQQQPHSHAPPSSAPVPALIPDPTLAQLSRVAVKAGLPFVAFGFCDNALMVRCTRVHASNVLLARPSSAAAATSSPHRQLLLCCGHLCFACFRTCARRSLLASRLM